MTPEPCATTAYDQKTTDGSSFFVSGGVLGRWFLVGCEFEVFGRLVKDLGLRCERLSERRYERNCLSPFALEVRAARG